MDELNDKFNELDVLKDKFNDLEELKGMFDKESGLCRPWVVSAWVVSANFLGGSFRP